MNEGECQQMGVFSVAISIGDTENQQWVELSATVDTGAFLMSMPGSLLRSLGVTPSFTENVRMADSRTRAMDIGYAWLRLNGREVMALVAFNDDHTTPLLGSLALETLRMYVDPVEQRLLPMDSIPL